MRTSSIVRWIANPAVRSSFFKTLIDHQITVELKNEICIRGTLKSVDQFLNIKLDDAETTDGARWPHLVRELFHSWTHCREGVVAGVVMGVLGECCLEARLTGVQCSTRDMFIRGSVVRYVHLPAGSVDIDLLEDATRKEAAAANEKAK